ncbi:hypothetical protein [Spelaeicoccus albus]|uniref:Uncharacterized protein n=1 Tax=Spelaeicoccus albus TaxID=1280376 RepID=A0A7Z0A8J2_9MICO|nr:hypothetical protein [Spelaeicoccus albus]NYI66389.1 hypothetical protein [Spelaeicoccus albus]
MSVHRALLTARDFADLALTIPGLELPRSFAVRRPDGVPAPDADGPAGGLPADSLDSLRFLLMCHQFSTVGVSVRAQTKETLLVGEYSVTYGLAVGLTRVQLARFPQSPGVQLCAMPVAGLPREIVDGVRQLQQHDRADVGVTIVPRSKGRDKTWLAAHSVCCLFSWRRRHADRPDIETMIADLCADERDDVDGSGEGGGPSDRKVDAR